MPTSYLRGLVLRSAIVTSCSTATGCYPVATTNGDLQPEASGTVADNYAGLTLNVDEGGYRPRVSWGTPARSWNPPIDVRRFSVVTATPRVVTSDPAMVALDDGSVVLIQQEAPGGGGTHYLRQYAVTAEGVATAGSSIVDVPSAAAYVWSPVLLGGDRLRLLTVEGSKIQIRFSDDDGATWSAQRKILDVPGVVRMRGAWAGNDAILLLEVSAGVSHYYSRDGGETWSLVATYSGWNVPDVAESGGRWIVAYATASRAYARSLGDVKQSALTATATQLYAGASTRIIAVSSDDGSAYIWLDEGNVHRQIDTWFTPDGGSSWTQIGQASSTEAATFSSTSASLYGVPLAGVWSRERMVAAWTTSNSSNDEYLWLGVHGGWTVMPSSKTDAGTQGSAGIVFMPGPSSLESLDAGNINSTTGGAGVAAAGQLSFYWTTAAGGDLAETEILSDLEAEQAKLTIPCWTTGDTVEIEAWVTNDFLTAKVLVKLKGSTIEVWDDASILLATLTGVNTDEVGTLSIWQSNSTYDVDANVYVSWENSDGVAVGSGSATLTYTMTGPVPKSRLYIRIPTTNSGSARLDVQAFSWNIAPIDPPQTFGRMLGAYPAYIDGGASLAVRGGIAKTNDTITLSPAYRAGYAQLAADSPRYQWVGTGATDISLTPVEGGGSSGPLTAMVFQNAFGWRTATVKRGATSVMSVDLAAGLTSLEFTRVGDMLFATSGSSIGRWLAPDELVGGRVLVGSTWVPIVGNTGGAWGMSAFTSIRLGEGFASLGSSGSMDVCAPRWAGVWETDPPVAATAWTLSITGTVSSAPTLGLAYLGRYEVFGWQYDGQIQTIQEGRDQLQYDDGQRALVRSGGAALRSVTLSWSDDRVPLGVTGGYDEDYLPVGSTLSQLATMVQQWGRSPLVLLRQVSLSGGTWSTTARDNIVYGRVPGTVEISLVQDDNGDEVSGGFGRSGQVLIKEEA